MAGIQGSARQAAWDWGLVLVGIGLAVAGFFYRGRPPHAGGMVKAEFTLVPIDASKLSCASDRVYGTHRCAHAADGRRLPSIDRPIVPVVTVGRELFFAAGLFQDPALVEYLQGPGRRSQKRFTATCRVRLVEQAADLQVRFRDEPFNRADPAWVADVLSCRVNPPDGK